MALMMKVSDQQKLALRLKASVKEYLYCNSPLRNEFQVRPVEDGEIKVFEGVKYARVLNENHSNSDEVRNKNVFVPFFELNCYCKDSVDFSDQFNGFNLLICEDLLSQEAQSYRSLKKYFTKTRKGVLLIRTDVQIVCANDKNVLGFSAFEQLGVVILNK